MQRAVGLPGGSEPHAKPRKEGRIIRFSRVEEPTILVFVGDHLPGLSLDAGGTLYTSLGYSSTSDTSQWAPEELKRMHATDMFGVETS